MTADNAKSGKARAIPLNDEAICILKTLDADCEFVFSSNGRKIKNISRSDFDRALGLSSTYDFRFHDLRHT
ncbi:MAG TPA: tyrosine-type recombinase/integrase [Arsenophonus sp.]